MKLRKNDSKKIDKLMRAVAKSVDGFSFHITPDGELQFTDEQQTSTSDYIVATPDYWFTSDGIETISSVREHDRKIFIGAWDKSKLIIKNQDGDIEYLTNTIPASEDFFFFMYAKLPGGVLVFSINEQHHTKVLGVQFYKSWYTELALRSMLRDLILSKYPDFGKTVTDTAEEDEVQDE